MLYGLGICDNVFLLKKLPFTL